MVVVGGKEIDFEIKMTWSIRLIISILMISSIEKITTSNKLYLNDIFLRCYMRHIFFHESN